ncbi:hypothetical protein PPERSA_12015 [Pseudocohnilembus persalinus]|uniref:Tubulin-tyrosine ligase family protein n=1 Tax=Pseudocohnilembus persalinus TaxID=266149 RepID=A0A0V0QK84_PSEPJ|nr:hypothetical protein PPERSA_12015 [Pseudocohnilembus persalinus]|eukprot:KRX02675.1 hypothetical protein PPERSA_12015 [Pseudocohnilembus persalinus]
MKNTQNEQSKADQQKYYQVKTILELHKDNMKTMNIQKKYKKNEQAFQNQNTNGQIQLDSNQYQLQSQQNYQDCKSFYQYEQEQQLKNSQYLQQQQQRNRFDNKSLQDISPIFPKNKQNLQTVLNQNNLKDQDNLNIANNSYQKSKRRIVRSQSRNRGGSCTSRHQELDLKNNQQNDSEFQIANKTIQIDDLQDYDDDHSLQFSVKKNKKNSLSQTVKECSFIEDSQVQKSTQEIQYIQENMVSFYQEQYDSVNNRSSYQRTKIQSNPLQNSNQLSYRTSASKKNSNRNEKTPFQEKNSQINYSIDKKNKFTRKQHSPDSSEQNDRQYLILNKEEFYNTNKNDVIIQKQKDQYTNFLNKNKPTINQNTNQDLSSLQNRLIKTFTGKSPADINQKPQKNQKNVGGILPSITPQQEKKNNQSKASQKDNIFQKGNTFSTLDNQFIENINKKGNENLMTQKQNNTIGHNSSHRQFKQTNYYIKQIEQKKNNQNNKQKISLSESIRDLSPAKNKQGSQNNNNNQNFSNVSSDEKSEQIEKTVRSSLKRQANTHSMVMLEFNKRMSYPENTRIFIMNSKDTHIRQCLNLFGFKENTISNSTIYDLKWTYNDQKDDYISLNPGQYFNHFKNNAELTTKSRLLVNLRNNQVYGESMMDEFFPRCYDLGNEQERQDFSNDFDQTAIHNMLKKLYSHYKQVYSQLFKQFKKEYLNKQNMKQNLTKEQKELRDLRKEQNQSKKQNKYNFLFIDHFKDTSQITDQSKQIPVIIKCLEIYQQTDILKEQKNWGNPSQYALKKIYNLFHYYKNNFPQFKTEGTKNVWVVKPSLNARGQGIILVDKKTEALDSGAQMGARIIQKYIERPFIFPTKQFKQLTRKKFDLRQWDENLKAWLLEVNLSPACSERSQFLKKMLNDMTYNMFRIILKDELQFPEENENIHQSWELIHDDTQLYQLAQQTSNNNNNQNQQKFNKNMNQNGNGNGNGDQFSNGINGNLQQNLSNIGSQFNSQPNSTQNQQNMQFNFGLNKIEIEGSKVDAKKEKKLDKQYREYLLQQEFKDYQKLKELEE